MNEKRRALIAAICGLGFSIGIASEANGGRSNWLGMGKARLLPDYESLRHFFGDAVAVRLSDSEIEGYFFYDNSDVESEDDGGLTIVGEDERRWKRVVSGRMIQASWFGVRANGVVDDWQNLMNAAKSAEKNGLDLILPPGIIRIRKGFVHPRGISIFGAGIDKTTVLCDPASENFAIGTCWHFGTYGPGNSSQGTPKFEVGYVFNPVRSGENLISLATAGDADRFSTGDLISLEGGRYNKNTLNTPNELATVLLSDRSKGTLKLDEPLRSDYLEGDVDLKVRKLNTGIPAPVSLSTMVFGLTAYALRGVTLADLTLISTAKGYTALNVSCFDCDFKRIRTVGFNAIAGNPCARSRFLECYGQYTNTPFELAYLSHDTSVRRCRFERVGRPPNPAQIAGIWVNNGEGAKFIKFEDVDVIDNDTSSISNHPVVEINGEGNKWIRGSIYSLRPVDAIQAGSRSVVDAVTILKTGGNGIVPGGSGGVVINNKIYGVSPGKRAVYLPASAAGNRVENNVLSRAVKTEVDAIGDSSVSRDNIKINNKVL